MSSLTRDNSHYQASPTPSLSEKVDNMQLIARLDVQNSLRNLVRLFAAHSIATTTRRAYSSDLRRFEHWGGSVPSEAATIAAYLADHAHSHSASTLRRWKASLSRAHSAAGFSDPTKIEPVVSTLRGICRVVGMSAKGASPLLLQDLKAILDVMEDGIRDKRDRALLLIGFAGGWRRSELVNLNVEDIQIVRRGLLISIRRSKTDQEGIGRQIAIPFGRTRHCPVSALESWLKVSGIDAGPVFRSITRHGRISTARLSGATVATIVKKRLDEIGIDPTRFSGHSLRSGFATSAALAGVSSWQIRQQTGHASDAMLARYIRSAELFDGNAAGAIL